MDLLTLKEVVQGVRALGLDVTVAEVSALPIFPRLPRVQTHGDAQYQPITVQVLADLFRMLSEGHSLDDAVEQIINEMCEVLMSVDLDPDAPDATSAYFYHLALKDCAWDMFAFDLVNGRCRESAPIRIRERLTVKVLDTQTYCSFYAQHHGAASAVAGVHRYARACGALWELCSYCDLVCEALCRAESYAECVDDAVMTATMELAATEDELETQYLIEGNHCR
jgi:hypothetical protein